MEEKDNEHEFKAKIHSRQIRSIPIEHQFFKVAPTEMPHDDKDCLNDIQKGN